jgi:cytochrome b561
MLRDTRQSFGDISIALHWLAAIAIAYLWLTGPDDHGGSASIATQSHIAMGSGLGVFLVARVLWRLASVNPDPLSQSTALNRVASAVKMLLLLDLLLILATGLLGVWFAGQPVRLFDAYQLPDLVGAQAGLVRPMRGLHSLSTNLLLPLLLGLHVAGAVKHLVWDRDGTFGRMLRVRSAN